MVNNQHDLNKQVILVDKQNKTIGIMDKILAHRDGILHRAYSILVFRKKNNDIELLLQQRSKAKYHGGGLWTNTCCSHPRQENGLIEDAEARLHEELGIKIPLIEVGVFKYFAELDNDMFEHEIDHVLIGYWTPQDIKPDPQEVSSYCWITIAELQNKLNHKPKDHTPWLSEALTIALKSEAFIQFTKKNKNA